MHYIEVYFSQQSEFGDSADTSILYGMTCPTQILSGFDLVTLVATSTSSSNIPGWENIVKHLRGF